MPAIYFPSDDCETEVVPRVEGKEADRRIFISSMKRVKQFAVPDLKGEKFAEVLEGR